MLEYKSKTDGRIVKAEATPDSKRAIIIEADGAASEIDIIEFGKEYELVKAEPAKAEEAPAEVAPAATPEAPATPVEPAVGENKEAKPKK